MRAWAMGDRALSELGPKRGRLCWAVIVAVVLIAGLGWFYRCWWLPGRGAEAVRSYFLAHQNPHGQGLLCLYYPNLSLGGNPRVLGVTRRFSFAANQDFPGSKPTYFTLRWLGLIHIPQAGRYYFGGRADDGLTILINGRVVAKDMNEAPARLIVGGIDLPAGRHALDVLYTQHSQGAEVRLFWTQPGGDPQALDPKLLTPLRADVLLLPIYRLRKEHGLVPSPDPLYDPLVGGRFWRRPW